MLHLTILASGSSGNAALVESDRTKILVDAGISCRQLVQRMMAAGVTPLELDGIFLTHEHIDHTTGLEVFLKQFRVPIYVNALTKETLCRGKLAERGDWRIFPTGGRFELKDLVVTAFSVPHDAVDPVGFTFARGRAKLGFLTDLGHATKMAMDRIRGVDTLLVEANYDEQWLLNDTKRPWSIKQRIMSRHGHLSNEAAAEVIAGMQSAIPRQLVLGHLSQDCNTPEIAVRTMVKRLKTIDQPMPDIFCAGHGLISPRLEVGVV
ncbi:MAG: MBL fold metallo-hydrolase [Verrucomicrobiales bacterium]